MTGETYLFNLSLLAITFAVISTLVMLLRQAMGGKLSKFDVYLVGSYISTGFVIAFAALLPGLVDFYGLPESIAWSVSSGAAAIAVALVVATTIRRRWAATGKPTPAGVKTAFAGHLIVVVMLLANALPSPFQGIPLFATAITLGMGIMLWTFTRRVYSLMLTEEQQDWDARRG